MKAGEMADCSQLQPIVTWKYKIPSMENVGAYKSEYSSLSLIDQQATFTIKQHSKTTAFTLRAQRLGRAHCSPGPRDLQVALHFRSKSCESLALHVRVENDFAM